MEEAFRTGGILEKPYKAAKDNTSVKREDVDLIVSIYQGLLPPLN